MIIWSGYGFLGALIPFILIVLHNQFLGPDTIGWALLTSAVPVWLLGRNFHARPTEIRIDPKTKQNVLVKPEHNLFWVELDYWAIIFAILGVAKLMPEEIVDIAEQIAWIVIPLIFFGRLGYGLYEKYVEKDGAQEKYLPNQLESSETTENIKENNLSNFAKKSSGKKQLNSTKIKEQMTSKENKKPSESELKKKAFYAQMRKDREREKNFKASDHANYFPGSVQPILTTSEIEEKIFFEEE